MNFKFSAISFQLFIVTVLTLFACNLHLVSNDKIGEDYYKLLGIERNADNREIRKAFKKLALTLHPDKNVDDPNAHEKFLKINRAYEVLKDEKTRNIYNMHGEEGLEKDNFARGHQNGYQTWNYYYENFGIYDNDEEIVTLSQADFELSVENTSFIWFINFYSPRCSHCHHLAPEWRKLAKELNSIIRIGAINCEEDRPLCQAENIRSYPSLVLYPNKVKYQGNRDADSLIDFVLKNLKIKQSVYKDSNAKRFLKRIEDSDKDLVKWYLLIVCYDKKECLFDDTRKMLSYKLKDFVNVVEIICTKEENFLCEHFGIHQSKVALFPNIKESPKNYYEISVEDSSIEANNIFKKIMAKFEKVPKMSPKDIKLLSKCISDDMANLQNCQDVNQWIIAFCSSSDKNSEQLDIELKSLRVFMPETKVFKLLCDQEESGNNALCKKFSISKYPTIVAIKDRLFYEHYYGRLNGIDVLNFAKESFQANLQTLNTAKFENHVSKSNEPWVVEFFAPWCPMCKTALQTLRKVSQYSEYFPQKVSFGVLDCTIYSQLCRQYNIMSYPTLLLYNQTLPHQFYGFYQDDVLLEYIENILESRVIELDPTTFVSLVEQRHNPNEVWAVDFFSPFCAPCNHLAPLWRKLANMVAEEKNIRIGQLNCARWGSFCNKLNVHSYPTLRVYPSRSDQKHKQSFYKFNDQRRDVFLFRAWIYDFLDSSVEEISNKQQFEKILTSDQPHLVDFYSPWAFSCKKFGPDFIRLSKNLTDVKFMRLNCNRLQNLCHEASIEYFPSIRFYSGTSHTKSKRQPSQGMHIQMQPLTEMSDLIRSFLPQKSISKDEL